jgi:hypothetical protein
VRAACTRRTGPLVAIIRPGVGLARSAGCNHLVAVHIFASVAVTRHFLAARNFPSDLVAVDNLACKRVNSRQAHDKPRRPLHCALQGPLAVGAATHASIITMLLYAYKQLTQHQSQATLYGSHATAAFTQQCWPAHGSCKHGCPQCHLHDLTTYNYYTFNCCKPV